MNVVLFRIFYDEGVVQTGNFDMTDNKMHQ